MGANYDPAQSRLGRRPARRIFAENFTAAAKKNEPRQVRNLPGHRFRAVAGFGAAAARLAPGIGGGQL